MLINWSNHCYKGPCQFDRDGDTFSVHTDAPDGRGSWFAPYVGDITPGQSLVFYGQKTNGTMMVLFFNNVDYMDSVEVNNGDIITVPQNINRIRVDLRLWDQQGNAQFTDVDLEPYEISTGEGLAVPPPDTTQKHHVTGYKWGRCIALFVQGDEDPVPPDFESITAYQVTGFQHGRRLDLDIGFPIYLEGEPAYQGEEEQE